MAATARNVGALRRRIARWLALAAVVLTTPVLAPTPAAAAVATSVSTGVYHSCTIMSGDAYCWGGNFYGPVGDGSTTNRNRITAVDTSGVLDGVTLTQIVAGDYHTCALSSAGAAYCWGYNGNGRLGDGTTTDRSSPVAVNTSGALDGVTLTQLALGSNSTCALSSTGAAYCWGANSRGQLGNNSTTASSLPVAVDTSGALSGKTVTRIAVGAQYACAIASGAAYCWGYNSEGQLGDGTQTNSSVPVAVATSGVLSGVTLTRVTAGSAYACALSSSGAAYCWGTNEHGELGSGSTATETLPVAVASGGVTWTQISALASGSHTCAVSTDHTAYCWGYNGNGQLGDDTQVERDAPTAVYTGGVLDGVSLVAVAAGGAHSCAATSGSAAVYCWGHNFYGNLGDGTNSQRIEPVRAGFDVTPPDPPTSVSAEAGDESAEVSWQAPADLGTGTLTGYTVTSSPGDKTCTTSTTTCTVEDLTNGTGYTFTVVATTTDGESEPSAASDSVTPFLAPGAPTNLTATPGDTTADLSWAAPTEQGSGTITGYTVTATVSAEICLASTSPCDPSPSCTSATTSCQVTGLTNGTTYTFVAVTNSTVGDSEPSATSAQVTPGAPELPAEPPSTPSGSLSSSEGAEFTVTSRQTTLTGTGFAPGTPVTIAIYSTPTVLTTTVSDADGAFSVEVTIPDGLSGGHTFVATGAAPGGGTRTLTLPVTVSLTDPGLADTGMSYLPLIVTVVLGSVLLAAGATALVWLRRRPGS